MKFQDNTKMLYSQMAIDRWLLNSVQQYCGVCMYGTEINGVGVWGCCALPTKQNSPTSLVPLQF